MTAVAALTCALGLWSYEATLKEPPHDGDTVRLEVDIGFGMRIETGPMRLYGINAPELNTPGGQPARLALAAMIPVDKPFLIHTIKDRRDKYGRILVVICPDGASGKSANARMIVGGHAISYLP